ncbi:MAG TPA: type VII secretion target [Lapillicoccus sp.]|jgi:hypothetical protein|uniref:type VII secretion target n=1 Tax=Lapillicoccus sp. TaxID=1909287 RepID=UPI002F922326
MPRYAVRPDDLEDAAALTAGDAPALAAARRLVAAAVAEAVAALGVGAGPLAAAVDGFGQVERVAAATLGDAAGILSAGLGSAAVEYARVDSVAGAGFGGRSPGGDR